MAGTANRMRRPFTQGRTVVQPYERHGAGDEGSDRVPGGRSRIPAPRECSRGKSAGSNEEVAHMGPPRESAEIRRGPAPAESARLKVRSAALLVRVSLARMISPNLADRVNDRRPPLVCWRLIVSVETFGPGRVARRLALARHRVRHPGQGDRHQHAGRQARRRRPRLNRGVRARVRNRSTPRDRGGVDRRLCGRGQQRVRDWRANARAERRQRIPPAARICFSSSVQLMMTRSLPPLVPLRIMMNRPSGVTS